MSSMDVSSVEQTLGGAGAALPARMQSFLVMWLGQFLSLTGSGITAFALGVWVYQGTGSVTKLALISACASVPTVLFSPFAGALVDRFGQKWAMLVGNCGACASVLALLALFTYGRIEVWHIYLSTVAGSLFVSLLTPAYNSSVTTMVPKSQYGRANGLIQLGNAVGRVGAPFLGGLLLLAASVKTILVLDVATFAFAVVTLLAVNIPRGEPREASAGAGRSFRAEVREGWAFLRGHAGLLSLAVFFAVCTFMISMVVRLVAPLVLGFASPQALGTVMAIGGVGMVSGGVAVSAWGGPERRVRGVITFTALSGLCILLAGLRPSVPLIAAAACAYLFFVSFVSNCIQTIIQTKVPKGLQGRIFSLMTMAALSATPLAYLLAGPLADYVFEPLLAPGGPLAESVGRLMGVGQGRGIGLLFVVLGLLISATSLAGYRYRPLRNLEEELPDAEAAREETAPRAAAASR